MLIWLSATPTAGQQTWTSLLRDDEGAPVAPFAISIAAIIVGIVGQSAGTLGVRGGVSSHGDVEFVSPLVWIFPFPEKNLIVVQQHAV